MRVRLKTDELCKNIWYIWIVIMLMHLSYVCLSMHPQIRNFNLYEVNHVLLLRCK